MLDKQTWRWLVRYFADECSEEEKKIIEGWIASDPVLKKEISNLRKIWNTPAEKKQPWDVDHAWQRFQKHDKNHLSRHLAADNVYTLSRKKTHIPELYPETKQTYKWLTMLAGVAAAILISLLFFAPPKNKTSKVAAVPMRVVTTHKGERIHLVLSDGTRILLNADSKLKIPHHFSGSARQVYLQGEAYFEVAHRKNQSFLVHAGNSVTEDLSTHFIVTAYPESGNTKVIVTEGKVSMHKSGIPLEAANIQDSVITTSHMGVLLDDGTVQISKVKNLMNWVGWTKGKLVFNNTAFAQVIPQLERWYDLNITIKDPAIANRRLTATYVDRQPMKEVLDAISLSLDLKYTIKNRSVMMYAKK